MNDERVNERTDESAGKPRNDEEQPSSPGLVREFFEFLIRDAVWWVLGILLVLAVIGVVIYLTADRPMPFIYQE